MKRSSAARRFLAVLALVLAGCADAFVAREGSHPGPAPEEVHGARRAVAPPAAAGEPHEDLDAVRGRIADARAAWEAEFSDSDGVFPFHDFRAGPRAELLEELRGEGYGKRFEGAFTLDEALAAAWLHNPGLKAARERRRAALDRVDEVERLDVVLRSYAAFGRALLVRAGPKAGVESVAKAFPAPGILELSRKAVDLEIRMAHERFVMAARDLAAAVRSAAATLRYADEALAVTRETLSLARALEEAVRTRYEGGEAPQGALLRAQVESSLLLDRVRTEEERRRTASAFLASLLGLAPGAALGSPGGFPEVVAPADSGPWLALALEHRQELRLQSLAVRRMEVLVALAETRMFPPHSFGLSFFERYTATREGSDRDAPPFPARPMTMPMPDTAVVQAHLDELRALLEGARETLEDLKLHTGFEVKRVHTDLDAAVRREALYRASLLDRAAQAFDSTLAAYRTARAAFSDVVDAQRTVLAFRLEAAAARRDAQKAAADRIRVTGTE